MDILTTFPGMYGVLSGCAYLLVAALLFVCNFWIFEKITPFDAKAETLVTQNDALGHILRWQLLSQGIMTSSVIYFLGITMEHGVSWQKFFDSILSVIAFGIFGILLLQCTLVILSKILPLEKEIIADQNVTLGKIIEWLLIAMGLIISVSLYAY